MYMYVYMGVCVCVCAFVPVYKVNIRKYTYRYWIVYFNARAACCEKALYNLYICMYVRACRVYSTRNLMYIAMQM